MMIISIYKETSTQLFAAISGTLIAVSDGMTYGWTSPFIPYLISEESHIKTTLHEAQWLESIELIGALCALPITIYLVDKIGRKYSMLLSAFIVLINWILIGFADRIEYIFVARFIAGLADDMCYVSAPMYIAEIADERIRGFLSSIIYIMMLFGILIVYCVGAYAPFYVTPLIGSCFALAQLIIFSFMPESPYFFVYQDKPKKARQSISYFKKNCDVENELKEIEVSVKKEKVKGYKIKKLIMVPTYRKVMLIMVVLNVAQHFAGISVVLMNLHLILEEAGSVYIDSSLAAIVFAFVMLVAAIATSVIIDHFGRKFLLKMSSVLTSLCLFIVAIYFSVKSAGYRVDNISWIPAAAVMLYAAVFKLGLGLIPIVITAEIFPTAIKAIGMTLADVTYVLFGIISLQLYQLLSEYYGIQAPFYVFAVCTALTSFFISCFIPETKGKTLKEIQDILERNDKKYNS